MLFNKQFNIMSLYNYYKQRNFIKYSKRAYPVSTHAQSDHWLHHV